MRPLLTAALMFVAGCGSLPHSPPERAPIAAIPWTDDSPALQLAVLNRLSWGANRSSFDAIAALGSAAWLGRQLEATANWHRIAREWLFGDAPSTELGELEQPFHTRAAA